MRYSKGVATTSKQGIYHYWSVYRIWSGGLDNCGKFDSRSEAEVRILSLFSPDLMGAVTYTIQEEYTNRKYLPSGDDDLL